MSFQAQDPKQAQPCVSISSQARLRAEVLRKRRAHPSLQRRSQTRAWRSLSLWLCFNLALSLAFFSACAESIDPPKQDKPKPDDKDKETKLESAEDWARALIAQKVSAAVAFQAISQSTGFPIETANGKLLFLHWHSEPSWSVAGGFNQWQNLSMTQVGADIHYAEVPKPTQASTDDKYKFVRQGQYVADPWARRYGYDENGEFSYYRIQPKQAHLQRWPAFASPQGLKARSLRVWVPASDGPYAVIYAHDGQNLFDPQAIGGGWKLYESLPTLTTDSLVVGIDNTVDRMREYIHSSDSWEGTRYEPLGQLYADFVENSVRPFIEKRYPVQKNKTALMGSSLGGLISLYIAYLYPKRYQVVIAMSPTLVWGKLNDQTPTMEQLYSLAGLRPDTILYVDSGGNEGSGCGPNADAIQDEKERDNYCFTRAFFEKMKTLGYQVERNLYHWHEPDALHNEAAWAARVFRPLKLFFELKL